MVSSTSSVMPRMVFVTPWPRPSLNNAYRRPPSLRMIVAPLGSSFDFYVLAASIAMTLSFGSVVRIWGVGLLLASLSLALVGCGDSAPVTAKNSKFQAAGEDEKESAKEGPSAKSGDDEGFPFTKESPAKSK